MHKLNNLDIEKHRGNHDQNPGKTHIQHLPKFPCVFLFCFRFCTSVCVVRTFNMIYILISNFGVHDTMLLTIGTVLLHSRSLEKAMASHSSTLAWKFHGQRSLVGCSPWGRWELDTTERLHFHFSLSCIGEGNGNPLQCSCLENPRDGGAWWAAIYGVPQSPTRLTRLSSSSSSSSITETLYPLSHRRNNTLLVSLPAVIFGHFITGSKDI